MFRVYWTNSFYFAPETFPTLEEAVAHGKARFFEFSVHQGAQLVAGWTVFGGLQTF